VVSGGPGECSFTTAKTSVNFGFNHMVTKSDEAAVASASVAAGFEHCIANIVYWAIYREGLGLPR
jgi:hypothetical protein